MTTARAPMSRPPYRRDAMVTIYALTVLGIAMVVIFGFGAVKQSSDRAAGAGAMAQAAGVRLALADDIIGYATALRQSDGSPSSQVQIAMRSALDRLRILGGIDRDPRVAAPSQADGQLNDLLDVAGTSATNLADAGAALLRVEQPDLRSSDQDVESAIDAVATSEGSYASALSAVANSETTAAEAASALARDEGIAVAFLLVVLVAAGIGLVIAPAHRTAARALERSVRSQEQNSRIRSEVAKHIADRDRRESEAQFQTLFHNATLGVALTDESGIIIDTNPALLKITGCTGAELRGALFGCWEEDQPAQPSTNPTAGRFDVDAPSSMREVRCMRHDGSTFWAEERISRAVGQDGRTVVCIGLVNDVTARKEAEDRLRHDAAHDTLTGLNNRRAFLEDVDRALETAADRPGTGFAVLFVDLDRFKFVNDSRGHAFGDAVLTEVGRRLEEWAQPGESVSRFGGDEFTALLPDVVDAERAIRRASLLHDALATPMHFGDLQVRTSASIGICVWSPSIRSAEEIVQAADAAAYRAKADGRACSVVYDTDMAARDRVRTRIGLDLRSAMENGELRVAYQPIVDLRTRRAVAFEALLRWTHPEMGDISPELFVPIAEESGLIVPIGDWVMHQAIHQLAGWQREHPTVELSVNINVSAQQLASHAFVTDLRSVLESAEVPGRSLSFELTETAMIDGDRLAHEAFDMIRSAGARVVLDDFGMGYSSLAHLARLPIDALKIDRLFVSGADDALASPAIVKSLIALSRAMDLDVIAEGVETRQQQAELSAMGCRFAQGFFYAKPLEEADASAYTAAMSEGRAAEIAL